MQEAQQEKKAKALPVEPVENFGFKRKESNKA